MSVSQKFIVSVGRRRVVIIIDSIDALRTRDQQFTLESLIMSFDTVLGGVFVSVRRRSENLSNAHCIDVASIKFVSTSLLLCYRTENRSSGKKSYSHSQNTHIINLEHPSIFVDYSLIKTNINGFLKHINYDINEIQIQKDRKLNKQNKNTVNNNQ